jgi:hypothetical protein
MNLNFLNEFVLMYHHRLLSYAGFFVFIGILAGLYKVLPFFRQLFFKDKLDFFSRPIGREKKSKQPGGKPVRVVCTPVIDVAA